MAEKRVQELLGQMQKTLECSICLEMMTNPVSTGCGHQFCRFCLMEFLERKRQVPCPLCKKPITKRSLMKREQLGEMVEGVRSLITAFQKDTGALFSPPRGPQTSLLPGTPDAIQAKSAVGSKTGKTPVQGNVRRTKRKQHVDLEAADSPILIESNESIPGTTLNSKGQLTVKNNINLSKKETAEKGRRLELLKCIEEGTLNADEFVEDSYIVIEKEDTAAGGMKAKSKSTSKKNSEKQDGNTLVSDKCDKKVKINLTNCAKDDKDTKQSKEGTVIDHCVIKKGSVKFKNAESVENKFINETNESSVNDCGGDTEDEIRMDIDPDGPVLSGASVAKESETSSGPLFKTPIDPQSLKHSKKGNDFSEYCKDIPKRSLRSMDKERNLYNDQHEVDNDDNSSVKLTPEVLVVKDKSVSRTYCKKDKDLFVKEKKATKKVAEWLKNIPSTNGADAIVTKHEITELKERNQHKRLSKKNLKVMQEEEAMGSKIKHLAKRIQENGQGLLFELDDFEEDKNTVTDSTLRTNTKDVFNSLENDPQLCGENEFDNVVIEGNMEHFTDENDRITDTGAENNCNKASQDIVGELSEDNSGVERNVGKEPVRKKRIFKSRTVNSVPSSESVTVKPTAIENIKNISAQKIKPKEENNRMISNEIIQIESQESELPSSDPYEFKSSQNTPKKVSKKKGKQKKGKVTNKAKGKQKGTENKVDVIQMHNKTVVKKFEKMWNKNLMPDKTILKTRNREEIDKMAASLELAEEYDLLTCTQEAAESIAKEKEKSETIALDQINQETCSKSDFVQKKVRFTEPVISDFIQTGKIDIIGYRKAREEFSVENNETGDKKNTQGGESKSAPGEYKLNLNDGENPLGQKDKANEDAESDDLSEDYHFHEDSSGTDDLDIEPTQEQFEKPNIEIQPEEIKAQLSQELLENVVQETPLIPVNKDSPNVNVIEETPAIFSVPKFNKTLSKPVAKSRKPVQVKTLLECDTKTVLDTPDFSVNKQHRNTKGVDCEISDNDTVEQGKHLPENKPKVEDVTDGIQSFKHEKMKADVIKLSADSDETKSPDVELILVQETDKNKIKEQEQMERDSNQETSHEVMSSESVSTQNSESLLQPHTYTAKILHTNGKETDPNEDKSNLNAGTEIQKGDEPNFKNDRGSVTSERSFEKVNPKKKRKSFMLEETEESLEFGSLSECVVSVVEDSESVCKAKRQRVNRLRRSPKNKEKVFKETSKDMHNTDTVVKDIGKNKEYEASRSVEIIPDTMADSDNNVNPLADIDGDNTGKDLANREGTNVVRSEDIKKETKLKKNFGEPYLKKSSPQFIDVSSESGSLSNLEERENCKQKRKRRHKKKNSNSDERDSQQGKLDNSSDKVDVIGETDIATIENMSRSEKKEKFGNLKIKENYKMITETFKSPNCLRSPEHRKKRKSGQSENDESSQHDIVRIRNLSGILDSPQDSLVLTGVKGSPVDIFQIDSEMPSVDLSPDEETLGLAYNSPSLNLGTLVSQESVVNDDNTQKRKSPDQSEVTSQKTVGNLINNSCEKAMKDKGHSDSLNLAPENDIDLDESKNEIKLDQDPDSSPEEKRRRSNVKAVRGFSKKKRHSDIGQSQMSGSSSGNSIIYVTPLAVTSVKYKSPVVNFLSPKTANTIQSEKDEASEQSEQVDRNLELYETKESPSGKKSKPKLVENFEAKQKQTDTPVKAMKKTSISKYSPLLMKQKKKQEVKKEAEFEPEVVELKHYDDEEEEECLLSPNDLPDLDIENVTVSKDRERVAQIVNPDFEISNDEQVGNKLSRRSRISPNLFINCSDKGKNVVLEDRNKNISDKIESECKTVIPETMSFDDDDNVDEEYDHVKCDKKSNGSGSIKDEQVKPEKRLEKVSTTIDDENSMNSSSSSDFRLDSSDDESPEKQALTEISKFDQIVEHSVDLENSYVLQHVEKSTSKNIKVRDEKVRKKRKHASIEKESFEKSMTTEHRQTKDQDNYKNGIKEIVPFDSENMYSTRLDSSPASCEEVNLNVDSEPVILESDLDDDASENDDSRGMGDKSVSHGTENKIGELESTVGNKGTDGDDDDDDDEEDSDDAVVKRKGVKRAILSDSSSEDEEGSRHMNMTSSSAFSSQSENLTTQERFSLEKEVERMAKEMEAMKEQLRRSKELNQSKNSESKITPKPLTVDDSDEDMIEANDSDNTAEEEDMFMSPPAITPGDLQMDDEETMDPAVVQEEENGAAVPGDTVEQVDESLALPLESLTVPESDPSQLSRPILVDLDTNITQVQTPNKKRQVGIVATGLNVQQLQQTKKLVALTDAKFFTKFNDSVTHVIVKPADEDETICDRTLKFFQGIARKCWIVNFFWVVDSRQVGHLLPEGPYEIQGDTANNEAHHGPKRSRLSSDKLFKKFQFSLIGDNTFLSKDSMADLIETCGGDIPDMAHLGQGHRIPLVISCTDLDDEEEDVQFIVKHARDIYKGLWVVTVTREWILDSLTLYRIQPLQDYIVTDVPNIKIPRIQM